MAKRTPRSKKAAPVVACATRLNVETVFISPLPVRGTGGTIQRVAETSPQWKSKTVPISLRSVEECHNPANQEVVVFVCSFLGAFQAFLSQVLPRRALLPQNVRYQGSCGKLPSKPDFTSSSTELKSFCRLLSDRKGATLASSRRTKGARRGPQESGLRW